MKFTIRRKFRRSLNKTFLSQYIFFYSASCSRFKYRKRTTKVEQGPEVVC